MQHKVESNAETKIEVRGLTKIFGKRVNRDLTDAEPVD